MSENNAMKLDVNGLRKKHSEFLRGRKRPDQSKFMKEHCPTKNPEARRKLSLSMKGKPSNNPFKKGHVGWNKGLTKETDERVRNNYKRGEL